MIKNENFGKEYIAYCRKRLAEEYLPRIIRCVDELADDDVWWRIDETNNSIGNLMLHLSGNVRQWICGGIGEQENTRDRALEFSERAHIPKEELLKIWETALRDADEVLKNFDTNKLLELRTIQVYEATCLDALSHVVEHFAQHLGQIIFITKLRTKKDLKFYNL
jgi:uncharacterized damage-inducible protein DinB